MESLKTISEDIWIIDGGEVPWYGMPYTTRTTVIRLESDELWVHSPGKIYEHVLNELNELGEVKYLISPNKIHHLFLKDWKEKYPNALLYSSPGLRKKRADIEFDKDLADYPEVEWKIEIDQLIFKGSPVMEEVVFFHRRSKTLILTDLIENFHPNHFTGYKNTIAKLSGIVSPTGQTPLDWRMSFIFGKNQARACLQRMISWQPEIIVISHGECIYSDAEAFLKQSFRWLE